MFEAWIAMSIPDRAPDGRAFTVSEKAELVAFCWQHKKQFFAKCRCLAVENALVTARTSNALRKPTESDGPDLQHAAVALAYCDIFYSRDGYQAQCAASARNIPIIFPWFGANRQAPAAPQHGFARTATWHLDGVETTGSEALTLTRYAHRISRLRGDAEPTKSVWQNRPLADCRRNNIVRLCFRKILNGNPQWWPFDPGHCRGTATAEEREPSPL